MLLLLLCLGALSHLTGAEVVDISSCAVVYFGKVSTRVEITSSPDRSSLCFLADGADPAGDCVHVGTRGRVSAQVTASSKSIDSGLPHLPLVSTCDVFLTITDPQNSGTLLDLYVFSLGSQAALQTNLGANSVLNISVGNQVVQSRTLNGSETWTDLTGCRHKGEYVPKETQKCVGTEIITCNVTGQTDSEQCGLGQTCYGSKCHLDPRCTVVGPVLVDFAGRLGLVPDLCSYTLLETESLKVVAEFRDRRRTDLGFIHRLVLTKTDQNNLTTTLLLGPGSQVQVNGSLLDFSADDTTVVGQIIVVHTGSRLFVTFPFLWTHAAVEFDGTHFVFLWPEPSEGTLEGVQGLCVNITEVSRYRDQDHSRPSCASVQTQPPDSSINCTAQAQRCAGLLTHQFVESCPEHKHFRGPVSEACSQTLCRYPDQDQVFCQFVEALAFICDLEGYQTALQNSECSVSPCVDTVCSDSEFCGLDESKEPRCLCRARVQQDFKQRETVCQDHQASVSVPVCVLKEKGLNVSDLHLNQESCRGTLDPQTDQVSFSFDANAQCGTQLLVQEDKVLYQNSVQFNSSSSSGLVSRKSSFRLDFSCFYSQPQLETIHLRTQGADGLQAAIRGSWPYNISVGMFSDLNLRKPIDLSRGLKRNQMIYISMESEGLDGPLLLLKADDCYATDRKGTGGPKYSLISGGCGNPQDSSIKVFPSRNNRGTVLRLRMFQFKGGKNVFLKCKMKLCVSSSPGCKPDCD